MSDLAAVTPTHKKTAAPRPTSQTFQTLLDDLRTKVEKSAPLSSEESEHQEAAGLWMARLPVICKKAQEFIDQGRSVQAEKLIEEFNLSKPKRRVGKPRKAGPHASTIRRVLTEELLELGLKYCDKDKGFSDRLVNKLLKPL